MRLYFKYFFIPFLLFLCSSCTEGSNYTSNNTIAEPPDTEPEKQTIKADTAGLAKATFAGGCFWCTEAYYERIKGVEVVLPGYTGGKVLNPTYEMVSSGKTDHAEAVQIYYRPIVISYNQLLEIFFATHDPTTLNRQGPDVGSQYRSIVFYRTPQEKQLAEQYILQLDEAGTYPTPVVTTVEPFHKFWPAEDYHHDYYRLNPRDPYIKSVAAPKLKKLESNFEHMLKPDFKQKK